MLITTQFDHDQRVVVKVDGSFVKATITSVRAYALIDPTDILINYDVMARWTGEAQDGIKVFTRQRMVTEAQLVEWRKLYADVKRTMDNPTEAKVLWEMRNRSERKQDLSVLEGIRHYTH